MFDRSSRRARRVRLVAGAVAFATVSSIASLQVASACVRWWQRDWDPKPQPQGVVVLDGDSAQWDAQYWSGSAFNGAPTLSRSQRGFFASTGVPAPGVSQYMFSARFTSGFTLTEPAAVTVSTTADDGVRISVDGVTVIDEWRDQSPTAFSAETVLLQPGTHGVSIDYYNGTWGLTNPGDEHVLKLTVTAPVGTATTTTASSTTRPTTTTGVPVTTLRPPPTTTPPTTTPPTTTPPTTTAPRPSGRDLRYYPFSAASPFNTRIGSGAQWGAGLPESEWGINAAWWSIAVYYASANDSTLTVYSDENGTHEIKAPAGVQPTMGEDGATVVVQPDGVSAAEMYAFRNNGDGTARSQTFFLTDLRSDGLNAGWLRAAKADFLGGLIREQDWKDGSINHALALSIPGTSLKQGYKWPAFGEDGFSNLYSGSVRMGTLFAIPPGVVVNELPLSADGLKIARALQQYGAYVLDQSEGNKLYAEPGLEGQLDDARNDLNVLQPYLREVTNSGPNSVGGGN